MRIAIYDDEGVARRSLQILCSALAEEGFSNTQLVNARILSQPEWLSSTQLLIIPGGRDLPYQKALRGSANRHIRQFVERGGRYLGICAGAYYASAFVEFEKGGPLEVLGARPLQFFPGVARGPICGLGRFDYESESGAEQVELEVASLGRIFAYYNGGCGFIEAEAYPNVDVRARFAQLPGFPAALIRCRVGQGVAILSGVHPEYNRENGLLKTILSLV